MKLHVEMFFTKLKDDRVLYKRDHLDLSYKSKDPDVYVAQAVKSYARKLNAEGDRSIIHSTSWRCEHSNLIVITYIVYSDQLRLKNASEIAIGELKIASSEDINKPKPKEIAERNVVSHGLRHISHLIKTDPVFNNKVSVDTKKIFEKIDAVLAGKIKT